MGPDVVEIALDSMTDATGFEKLAAEVMRDMGYPRIVPLGGVHDLGRDAIQEQLFHCDDKVQTVFQFTLSADVTAKTMTTIKKLAQHKVEYGELVVVTAASVSVEKHDALVARCRNEHGVSVRVYDRKVLVNKLADFRNQIFYRFFPDIERQVRGLLEKRTEGVATDERFSRAALIVCQAFVLHEGAGRARKEMLDHMVTSILLAGGGDGLSLADVSSHCGRHLGAGVILENQLSASLDRLCRTGVAVRNRERFQISEQSLQTLVGADVAMNAEETSVVQDLVDGVAEAAGASITDAQRDQLRANARAVLAEFFKLFGVELSDQFLRQREARPVYREGTAGLVAIACQWVPRDLGNVLVAAVGEALARPTSSQAHLFACYARAYLALAVLNLDPTLRGLQMTALRTKTFILDTDVVLNCIISEAPRGAVFPRIVQALQEVGCRTLIPQTVLSEVAKHAEIAPRTYRHVEHSLLWMPEPHMLDEVGNAFVRGYYYAKTTVDAGRRLGFADYLRNYYEPSDPERFLVEVIRSKIPGVEVLDVETLLSAAPSEEERLRFGKCLLEIEVSKPKAARRTQAEMEAFADTDARLLQIVIELNRQNQRKAQTVLGADVFLVTNSGRYLSCMKTLGIQEKVSSRPQVLMGLLELIGRRELSDGEFVSLFENPLLHHAVSRTWEQVRVLLDAGLALGGSSLPRLSWDLDRSLNAKITELSQAEARAEASEDDAGEGQAVGRYVELLEEASSRGYRTAPVVKELLTRIRDTDGEKAALEKALQESTEKFAQLEEAIEFFGKRKQRYLRRMQRARKEGDAALDGL